MIKTIEKILVLLLFAIAIIGIIVPISASESVDSKNKMYSIDSKKKLLNIKLNGMLTVEKLVPRGP